ncbi:MAG: WbqC family protein [Verrucomicrobiales bacterium]|nr:WbqC family protein [Verrucomicrobiales bacterium]
MKKIAILQPNYLPWKGVFDLINRVDTFVFFDDVQYTKKDWRNRNRVKTHAGLRWISVPVTNGSRDTLIKDVEIDGKANWAEKHWKTISLEYKAAPFFNEYADFVREILCGQEWGNLCDLDIYATKKISDVLGIDVEWVRSSDLDLCGDKSGERVIKICNALGCDSFINGPASRQFMDDDLFRAAGIKLDYIEYNYEPYPQLHGDFVHEVTVLDVLFNCGPESASWIFHES